MTTAMIILRGSAPSGAESKNGKWLKVLFFCAIVFYLYARVVADLAVDWWTIPSQSQGLLIPPLALFIAWDRRPITFSVPAVPDNRGLLAIAGACAMFLIGKLGAEYFFMRISIVALLCGCIWTLWGLRRLRTLALPLLLLATMVPLPALVYNVAAAPLQLLASSIATDVAQGLGVSVYRDGNIIHLANISLGVEEACSGLNSVTALFVGSILLGYLNCKHNAARFALICTSVPIAIVMNVLRVSGTAVIADVHEEFALGFYHAFSGWLVFLIGFGALYVTARILSRLMDPLWRTQLP